MNHFSKKYLIEIEPNKFEPTELVIRCEREFQHEGATVYQYFLTFPQILDSELSQYRGKNELEVILNLVDRARQCFKDFHKRGGRMYEVDDKGNAWTQYGPMKPKDLLLVV
jgi:hypothetical protein